MIITQISLAEWVTVDSLGFNGLLSSSDDTVQKCLQKLDDLTATQISVNTNLFDGLLLTSNENTVQKCVDKISSSLNSFIHQNGFVNRTDSSFSFTNGTRTFTIQPVASSFVFFSYGVKYIKSSAQSIVIPNTHGLWHIYFNAAGTLEASQTFTDLIITKAAYTASVYWDAISSEALMVGDERHGYEMDSQTHLYLHSSLGTQFGSPLGFSLTGLITDGNGSLDAHAQIGVSGGSMWDEDIKFIYATQSNPASCLCFYLTGSGVWRKLPATNFPLAYTVGGLANWNRLQTGVWSLVECSSGDFTLTHIFATNDLSHPFIVFVGQAVYNTIALARAGANTELNNLILTGMPTQEMVPIASLIWETRNSYNNTPKSRIRSTDSGAQYIDWRLINASSGLGGSISSWGNITGTLTSQNDLSTALSGKQPLDEDLTAIGGLAGTSGFLKKTNTNTWELVTKATGWTEPSGTLNRTSLSDGSSQSEFNQSLMALITDLISKGLIGA